MGFIQTPHLVRADRKVRQHHKNEVVQQLPELQVLPLVAKTHAHSRMFNVDSEQSNALCLSRTSLTAPRLALRRWLMEMYEMPTASSAASTKDANCGADDVR